MNWARDAIEARYSGRTWASGGHQSSGFYTEAGIARDGYESRLGYLSPRVTNYRFKKGKSYA